MSYFVYVDWTMENDPRPFYVGIGSLERALNFRRNWSHYNIKKKFGISRSIVFETSDRNKLCLEERALIKILRTFIDDPHYNGIGANLTPGGDHPGEFSQQTRQKQSLAAKNRPPISEKTRQRLRNRPFSDEHRKKLSSVIKNRIQKGKLEWNLSREKRVRRLDSNGNVVSEHSSITMAALETKTSRSLISQVLNRHRQMAKGYRWEYVK